MRLLYFIPLGYAGIMEGGSCELGFFFPTASTEKKHCMFSYTHTKNEYSLIHVPRTGDLPERPKKAGTTGQWDKGGGVWDFSIEGSDI